MKAIGHQIKAINKLSLLAAAEYAVSEFSGRNVEYSITGKMVAAPIAMMLPSKKFEAMKARFSLPVEKPEINVMIETTSKSSPSQQIGLRIACAKRSGRTTNDSTEIT